MVFEYAQLRGTLNGMDTTVITELAEYYEKEIGYHIPPRTPFVGKNTSTLILCINPCFYIRNKLGTLFNFICI